jgi:GT2 family glycosyltransferase
VARKSVFDRVGLFDPQFVGGGDVDWFARAKDMGMPTVFLDAILLKKRIHGGNLTIQNQSNDTELLRIIKRTVDRQRAKAGN